MTGPGPTLFGISLTIIGLGIVWRISQAVLWILNGRRS